MSSTFVTQIINNIDDVYRRLSSDSWSRTLVAHSFGATNDAWQAGVGLLFKDVTVHQGARINVGTKLSFYAYPSRSVETVNARISAEDVDDASDIADNSATFDARWAARTSTRIDWDDVEAWTANTWYDSPELQTLIQEIIDRPGWVSGNSILIFVEDFEDRSSHVELAGRSFRSHDHLSTLAPKLTIIYAAPAPPVVVTYAVTDILTTTATGNGKIISSEAYVTQHGHCLVDEDTWDGGNHPPTVSDTYVNNGASPDLGVFTTSLTGLVEGTRYAVRACAISAGGTGYGGTALFTAAKGTVFPDPVTDPLRRVSGIQRTFWAGIGGQSVYQAVLTLGGMSTTYVSPIGEREPPSAVKPTPVPSGAGYQQSDYENWLRSMDIGAILKIFGHFPTYAEWVSWKRGPLEQVYVPWRQ